MTPAAGTTRDHEPTPWAWSSNRLWGLSFVLCIAIAALDVLVGPRLVLIGLLVAGPCCAVLTGRWIRTAISGAFAIAVAIALGVPDGIWGSYEHLIFVSAVTAVTVVSTLAVFIVESILLKL